LDVAASPPDPGPLLQAASDTFTAPTAVVNMIFMGTFISLLPLRWFAVEVLSRRRCAVWVKYRLSEFFVAAVPLSLLL
jgi:hypothetical protein